MANVAISPEDSKQSLPKLFFLLKHIPIDIFENVRYNVHMKGGKVYDQHEHYEFPEKHLFYA